jgi:hypothetical protein
MTTRVYPLRELYVMPCEDVAEGNWYVGRNRSSFLSLRKEATVALSPKLRGCSTHSWHFKQFTSPTEIS